MLFCTPCLKIDKIVSFQACAADNGPFGSTEQGGEHAKRVLKGMVEPFALECSMECVELCNRGTESTSRSKLGLVLVELAIPYRLSYSSNSIKHYKVATHIIMWPSPYEKPMEDGQCHNPIDLVAPYSNACLDYFCSTANKNWMAGDS